MTSSGNVKSKEVWVCFHTHTHSLFWTHRSRPLLMLRKLHLLDLEAEVKTNLKYISLSLDI